MNRSGRVWKAGRAMQPIGIAFDFIRASLPFRQRLDHPLKREQAFVDVRGFHLR